MVKSGKNFIVNSTSFPCYFSNRKRTTWKPRSLPSILLSKQKKLNR